MGMENEIPEPSKEQIAAWRRDARRSQARRNALDLAISPQLAAEAELRKESENAVQQQWPQDVDHLEQVLWPSLRNYSEKVFDSIAEAKLNSLGSKFLTRRYSHWLRCTCAPAVVDDVSSGVRLWETAKHIFDAIGDARWPIGIDHTRRALARLMTELLGGPHAESVQKRVDAVLKARIGYWESKAIEKQSAISVQQVEKDAKASNHNPEVNAPGAMVADVSRRELVNAFLARCNQVSTVRIVRADIWRSVGHRHARQFEHWQAGNDRPAGTTRGATKQDNHNFLRILAMRPEEFVAQLGKSGTTPAKS
jgi:hypothetical protein